MTAESEYSAAYSPPPQPAPYSGKIFILFFQISVEHLLHDC